MKSGEFELKILAPETEHQCYYARCKRYGTWRFVCKNDHNQYEWDYQNICMLHLIVVFIELVLE